MREAPAPETSQPHTNKHHITEDTLPLLQMMNGWADFLDDIKSSEHTETLQDFYDILHSHYPVSEAAKTVTLEIPEENYTLIGEPADPASTEFSIKRQYQTSITLNIIDEIADLSYEELTEQFQRFLLLKNIVPNWKDNLAIIDVFLQCEGLTLERIEQLTEALRHSRPERIPDIEYAAAWTSMLIIRAIANADFSLIHSPLAAGFISEVLTRDLFALVQTDGAIDVYGILPDDDRENGITWHTDMKPIGDNLYLATPRSRILHPSRPGKPVTVGRYCMTVSSRTSGIDQQRTHASLRGRSAEHIYFTVPSAEVALIRYDQYTKINGNPPQYYIKVRITENEEFITRGQPERTITAKASLRSKGNNNRKKRRR